MVSVQEPEVQFAQRLASNDKSVRTRAMKVLRKYIRARSHKAAGGFTSDDLLRVWKGLFYCLWMQDKPLLQEELSRQISSLIHSFQDVTGQLLFLESFLQTFKREWTGIDRLRMDKFYQLVRFMFRQTFDMLRKKDWESSVVSRFLELLTAQLLQSASGAPSGLQIHILDLYMTELTALAAAELTADQNLMFIEPFCKTAAKTKDRTLFGAICSSIFSTIIDQAPFAIEDLIAEVKAAEASESEDDEDEEDDKRGEPAMRSDGNKGARKQINGKKSGEVEDESDTEAPCADDVGPVLQFDYGALADKLFELASRSSTPSHNRHRLYKIIKVLRDLSEGVFPQDEYPEEVSTDEDDDMFGSRKRMKRRRAGEEEEEALPSKKSKGKKKEASMLTERNNNSAKDDGGKDDLIANPDKKKRKKKRKKKKKRGQGENAEEQIVAKEVEDSPKEAEAQSSVSSVKVTEAATAKGLSEPPQLSGVKNQPSVTVTEETSHPTANEEPSEKLSVKKPEAQPAGEPAEISPDTSKKKKKKKKGLKLEMDLAESQVIAEIMPVTDSRTPTKRKKSLKTEMSLKEVEDETQVNSVSAEEAAAAAGPEILKADSETGGKKKSKKKNLKFEVENTDVQVDVNHAEIPSVTVETAPDVTTEPPQKKKKKKDKRANTTLEASPDADESTVTPLKKKRENQEEYKTTEEDGMMAETPQAKDTRNISKTSAKKNKKKFPAATADKIKDPTLVQVVGSEAAELPEVQTEVFFSPRKPKKKRKIPVVFEFEADELEAAASTNGLAEEEAPPVSDVVEPSTQVRAKKSQGRAKTSSGLSSDFVTFQSNAAVPTPLFCRTKGGTSAALSSNKKKQNSASESKKVTFGLRNNKTAEFKKTDRSLLLSPDGSSRVPFDPKQKPKFGVLKPTPTPLSARVKKTPGGSRKSSGSPWSTPKGRPKAADFF